MFYALQITFFANLYFSLTKFGTLPIRNNRIPEQTYFTGGKKDEQSSFTVFTHFYSIDPAC